MAKEEGPRSFARFLEQACDGDICSQASEALHELLKKLEADSSASSGVAKGKLTLTVSFGVDPRGQVAIGYDITTKEPKPARAGGIAWLTKGANCTFENPKQQKLPLAEVPRSRTQYADDPAAPAMAEDM
jgi:hypothetical protein